jgi:hypothetical protein
MLTNCVRVEPIAEDELGFTHSFNRVDIDLEGILLGQRHT